MQISLSKATENATAQTAHPVRGFEALKNKRLFFEKRKMTEQEYLDLQKKVRQSEASRRDTGSRTLIGNKRAKAGYKENALESTVNNQFLAPKIIGQNSLKNIPRPLTQREMNKPDFLNLNESRGTTIKN
jgi:hypothetical protein